MLRDGNRRAFGRSSGGVPPNFWAAFNDAGAGAVSLALTAGTGSATFTRATTAWTKLSTGLWAQVGTGVARSCYTGNGTTVGVYGGYFAEGAATNLCLQSRDMTNASWTKVTMTAALDQTGIDGGANTASSLTATAGAATCLQTITEAATASALSMFIKRITGVGTVTIQQGASTSEISGSLNSSTYTRVELDATVLNPAIGISLGTNGDKIAVDMVQFENSTTGAATSPIPTTTVAVTRNSDLLTYPVAGNIADTAGTAFAQCFVPNTLSSGTHGIIADGSGVASYPLAITSGPQVGCYDGTGVVNATGNITVGASFKAAANWTGATRNVYRNGTNKGTGAYDGTITPAALNIGAWSGAASGTLYGMLKNVKLWTIALSDAQIASL